MGAVIDARAAVLSEQILLLVRRDGDAHARTGDYRASLTIDDGDVLLYGDYPALIQWSDNGYWGKRLAAAAECMAYAIACAEADYVPPLPAQLDH